MKIPSNELEAFYTLTKIGNFTRAAHTLGLSQPAFSQRIKNLESFLEQTLFIREKRATHLTPEGEKLLRYVKVHQKLEEEFLETDVQGQIRIGGFSSVMRSLVMPALSTPLKDYPNASVELFTKELNELFPLLRQGRVDYIVTNHDPQREGFKAVLLGVEENVLVTHKDDLKSEVFLDHDANDSTTNDYFKLLEKPAPMHRRYLDDVYGLIDGVKLGLGKAILPRHLIRNEKALIIQRARTILKSPIYLVTQNSSYTSKIHRDLEESLISYFKKAL